MLTLSLFTVQLKREREREREREKKKKEEKTDPKLTLHHMGKILSVNLQRQTLTSGGLHFLNVFNHRQIMGLTSDFQEIIELWCAHAIVVYR